MPGAGDEGSCMPVAPELLPLQSFYSSDSKAWREAVPSGSSEGLLCAGQSAKSGIKVVVAFAPKAPRS